MLLSLSRRDSYTRWRIHFIYPITELSWLVTFLSSLFAIDGKLSILPRLPLLAMPASRVNSGSPSTLVF